MGAGVSTRFIVSGCARLLLVVIMASAQAWSSEGLTQEDFMYKDECILLDEDDNVVGHDNKYTTHRFNPTTPRGILHRAFSVFLFNSEGKMLLQQRAASKITFPNVWTNTCCSHPLHGYNPTEVDQPADVQAGTVLGVKRAAIRKLEHELGIPAHQVPIEKFKFLTRLHYWAADVVTHGSESEWGEHEIDYVLFIQADVDVTLNPDEIDDVKYVTLAELQAMMDPSSGLLWSPWFRILAEKFLVHWWKDLNVTLTTDKFVDLKNIHRFDPTPEHMGGGGHARDWLGQAKDPFPELASSFNQSLKQGAYGKIPIHSESTLSQLTHLDEVFAAFRYKLVGGMDDHLALTDPQLVYCDQMLVKVSRSFAGVIKQLPKGLCVDIMVFYLVLRALDTVEDDMEAFADANVKVNHLTNFYKTALENEQFSMTGVGRGDEANLLENFSNVVMVYQRLPKASQEVIADITKRMGEGMAEFVGKDLGQGTLTIEEYNRYCHFVAGLVGHGLSRLFVACGYEDAIVGESLDLANRMGLFLQKTNIIRDYLEDYVDKRAFWPAEVWKQYTTTGDLGELATPAARDRAVQCLNHLVTDALELMPACLDYLSMLRTPEVFRFCAIPQVMAIATLDKVYNNPNVFTGVVKIRKGLSVKMILDTSSMDGVHKWFNHFCHEIKRRAPRNDPSYARTREICDRVIGLTSTGARNAQIVGVTSVFNVVAPAVALYAGYYLKERHAHTGSLLPRLTDTGDVVAVAALFACMLYLLAFSAISLVLPASNVPAKRKNH